MMRSGLYHDKTFLVNGHYKKIVKENNFAPIAYAQTMNELKSNSTWFLERKVHSFHGFMDRSL